MTLAVVSFAQYHLNRCLTFVAPLTREQVLKT